MSLKLLFVLLALAALGGAVLGFVLRWLLVLARKGSKEVVALAEASVADKTEKIARAEERVFKREEALDKKQDELEQEITAVKAKIEDVRAIKERAEALLKERADELAKVAGLTKDEARVQLMAENEREAHEDFMMRGAKLERRGHERLQRQ